MRLILALFPLALVAASEPPGDRPLDARTQASLDKALAGRVAGKPTSCVPFAYTHLNTRTFGLVILYQQGNGTIFRNDTTGGCENAARGDILVSVQFEGRPCSGDIIRTVEPVARFTTGSCALRQFVPYAKPAQKP